MSVRPAPDDNRVSPWRPLALMVGVLALLWFAFPGGVRNWVADHCDTTGGVCAGVYSVAVGVEDVSRVVGVEPLFSFLRQSLREGLGIAEY